MSNQFPQGIPNQLTPGHFTLPGSETQITIVGLSNTKDDIIKELRATNDSLVKKIEKLEERLRQSRAREALLDIESIKEENEQLKSKIENLEKENALSVQKFGDFTHENRELRNRVDEIINENNELGKKISDLEKVIIYEKSNLLIVGQLAYTFELYVSKKVFPSYKKPKPFNELKNKLPQDLSSKFTGDVNIKRLVNTINEIKSIRKPIHPTSLTDSAQNTTISEQEFRTLLQQYYNESAYDTSDIEPVIELMIQYIKDENNNTFFLKGDYKV